MNDPVLVHDPGAEFGSGRQAFHHGDRHGVLRIVQYGVNHGLALLVSGAAGAAARCADNNVRQILWPRLSYVN